jgi:excinuclease Cho
MIAAASSYNAPMPPAIDPLLLDALPRSSGVYIFLGEGTLPLYIGKSIDIRSRVLSHLRNHDEARIVAQIRKIEYIETAGEIGALLLESQMIKVHNPLFNIRLRRVRSLCTWQLIADHKGRTPHLISGQDTQLGITPHLYGVYSSRQAATQQLRELAQQHQLCLGLLGLEKINRRGCFGLQIRQCMGACVGKEDRSQHDARLQQALEDVQIHAWPHAGIHELVEQQNDWVQKHHIHNWQYLGTHCSRSGEIKPLLKNKGFDFDVYKILYRTIMKNIH